MFLGGIALFLSLASASLPIQMGDTWDRELLKNVSDSRVRELAVSVGRVEVVLAQTSTTKELEVGTAFVVGTRGDDLIVATNYHVMPKKYPCTVYFTSLGESAACKSFLGSWKDIELALFTVKGKKLGDLKKSIPELDGTPLTKRYRLLTMGYGYYKNKNSQLTIERSDYCRVFSDGIRFVPANEGHGAFSFAHGCEISTSDSGSPIFDADTGKIVGIQWAATVRDKDNILSENFLNNLLSSLQPTAWNSLNYAVPAQFIIEKLNQI